jgi:hypothetical protein
MHKLKRGKIFNVSSNHVSSPMIKNGNASRMRPKAFMFGRMCFHSEPDKMQAGKEPDGLNVTRKALRHPE